MQWWLDIMSACFPMLRRAQRYTLQPLEELPAATRARLEEWKVKEDLQRLQAAALELVSSQAEIVPSFSIRGFVDDRTPRTPSCFIEAALRLLDVVYVDPCVASTSATIRPGRAFASPASRFGTSKSVQ